VAKFLKKIKKASGVFMLELLIVMAILVIIATAFFFAYQSNFNKSLDGKRKTDLYTIAQALEEYEKDNESYPSALPQCNSSTAGSDLEGYMAEVPCDPRTGQNFIYEVGPTQTTRTWYRIYSRLQVSGDPDVAELGCQAGCGPGSAYNYYVSSPNSPGLAVAGFIPNPPPTPTNSPTPTPSGPTPTPTPSSTPTPTPTPIPSLLTNPGFESGSTSWIGVSGAASIVSSQSHSGVNSLQIVQPASGQKTVYQTVNVTAGQNYTLSGWMKSNVTDRAASITVSWRDSAGAPISLVTVGIQQGTVNWTQYSINATAPVGAVTARFILGQIWGAGGTAWFDDLFMQ